MVLYASLSNILYGEAAGDLGRRWQFKWYKRQLHESGFLLN